MNHDSKNPSFTFDSQSNFCVYEEETSKTREPWLMLIARRGQNPTKTLCWGLTNNGSSFARIGTQEGDLVNGFVHEDPYKTRILGAITYLVPNTGPHFTNTWYPVLHKDQKLTTRYGLGWLEQETAYGGLQVRTTSFIPNQFDAMVQILRITNTSPERRDIALYTTNPINIGDARSIQFSGFNTLMMGGGIIDEEIEAIVWRNSYGIPFDDDSEVIKGLFGKLAVHGTSLSDCSFSTKYEDFVGHYSNSMANPAALKKSTLKNTDAQELTSSLSVIRGSLTLEPGQTRDVVVFTLTASPEDYYTRDKSTLKTHLTQLRDPQKAWGLLDQVKKGWAADLAGLQIQVPGEDLFNHSFSWLQYQCAMVAIMNRMKSRFHSGFEYGYGFRDILQDLLALLPTQPRVVADLLGYVAEQMFSDGEVYHNFFVSAPGNRDFKACDDPLWFVFAVCEYVKETGDEEFLSRTANYADAKEGLPATSGSILEHCITAIEAVWRNSERGLPRMMDADWNDDLSAYQNHLSVMAAQMLYKALQDLTSLLEATDRNPELIPEYQNRAAEVKTQVEQRGIDPQGHYIRAIATEADEADLGSSLTDGFVFFEPIAWSGYSGIADKPRFDVLKKAVEAHLDDEFGIALCQGDSTLIQGRLPQDYAAWKRNAPGKKENGGEFRHLESWYMASLCIFGYGNEAWELCRKTLPPVAAQADPYRYAAEPFVYPEYVSGPASSEHGRAGHTWLTGTAPTRLGMIIQYIFGLRPSYQGLEIDPCVSSTWKGFTAYRTYRDTGFSVEYRNPRGAQRGVKSISIDGEQIDGNLIPLSWCDGGEHQVIVEMGGF